MRSRAIVLGNGSSRLGIDIPDDCFVYACNLAYKESIKIDCLVATDAHRQHEIYSSGYANTNRCVFLEWNSVPSGEITSDILRASGMSVTENKYTDYGVVITGWRNTMFCTYLNENDCVENLPMSNIPSRYSTGSLAIWLAAKEGFDEILLAGFGDKEHAYREYKMGADIPHIEHWEAERYAIKNTFSNVIWREL